MNLLKHIKQLTIQAFSKEFPDNNSEFGDSSIDITEATQDKFGHYQCNSAMKMAKPLKLAPRAIAEKVQAALMANPIFEKIEVAGPGFLNLTLKKDFFESEINKLINDKKLGVETPSEIKKIIAEYSQPNTAKEMHVGHLRSTIIGDCIANVLEFIGHKVLRLNHIGDWGTQFGMLIAYIKNNHPEEIGSKESKFDLPDLMKIYRASKQQFDEDNEFKTQARNEVVLLQSGEKQSLETWEKICDISRKGYQEIYDILGIKNLVERGESYYNSELANVIGILEEKGLTTFSEGAKCVYLDGFVNKEGAPLPLMVQKSDGGYNYATTDLAAVHQRSKVEKADWVIYVVDAGQSLHFDMVFKAAEKAEFFNPETTKFEHVPFGLVLREDGKKFKTRSGDTEKLIDLIHTAIDKSAELLKARTTDISETELKKTSEILGVNAIKYADLSTNRTSDYKFSYGKMLQFEGNTAACLTYAYVRIQSIKRKILSDDIKAANASINELLNSNNIKLDTPEELSLCLHLLKFAEVIDNFTKDLSPHRIAEYLYKLSEKFHIFFHNCRVEGSDAETSRLLLSECVGRVLAKGFELLGLKPLDKM